MSPARTNDPGIDFSGLVHRILLDVTLLRWFSATGGQRIAVLSALASARREGANAEARILDFLEQHIGEQHQYAPVHCCHLPGRAHRFRARHDPGGRDD